MQKYESFFRNIVLEVTTGFKCDENVLKRFLNV